MTQILAVKPQKAPIVTEELDAVDARILDLLQRDASLSIADIAERVGLSSSPAVETRHGSPT